MSHDNPYDPAILDLYGEKGKTDPGYAIAYAMLAFAAEFSAFRQAMTFGQEDARNRHPGIGEKLCMEMVELQQNVGALASAVQQIADQSE